MCQLSQVFHLLSRQLWTSSSSSNRRRPMRKAQHTGFARDSTITEMSQSASLFVCLFVEILEWLQWSVFYHSILVAMVIQSPKAWSWRREFLHPESAEAPRCSHQLEAFWTLEGLRTCQKISTIVELCLNKSPSSQVPRMGIAAVHACAHVQVNEAQKGVSITWTGRGLPLASESHQTGVCCLKNVMTPCMLIFQIPWKKPTITKVALGTEGCELGSDRMEPLVQGKQWLKFWEIILLLHQDKIISRSLFEGFWFGILTA